MCPNLYVGPVCIILEDMNGKRTLNLSDSISIVSGSMIGCGIFIVSADIARQVQSGLLMMLVWIVAAIVTMCGALSFAELASNIEEEGGQYIYLKKIYNDGVAFLYGWTTFLVIQTGTIAAVCTAFSKFIGLLIPFISTNNCFLHYGAFHISTQKIFTVLIVVLLTFINSKGLKYGVIIQNLFTITKILSLIGIVGLGLFFGCHFEILHQNLTMPINLQHSTINAIAVASVGALFASITWNNITFVSGEIKEAEKTIPKALFIGTAIVLGLYFLINSIYVSAMPLHFIQNAPEDIVAAQLMSSIFGDAGKTIIAVIIMISAFGCANGMILAGSRVYYKMAKDKAFFRGLAAIDRQSRVPHNSLWIQCLWVCLLVLWGNYTQLLDYVIYTTLIFYWITTVGIFIYRKKVGIENLKYRINSFIPLLFLVITGYIIVCLTIYKPSYTLPGLLITLAGLPVFYLRQRGK